jgi:hypothetical protein
LPPTDNGNIFLNLQKNGVTNSWNKTDG